MGYLILIAAIAGLDQFVKYLIVNRMALYETVEIWPFLHFTYVQNTGAAFSLLKNGTLFLGIMTMILLLLMAVFWRKPYVKRYHLPLALLCGGAVGNFIDRIFRGYVVDYIQVTSWFPVFNIADMMVVTGVALMALLIIKSETREDGKNEKRIS